MEDKLVKFKEELQKIVGEINQTRKQIATLDKKGQQLTAEANVIQGKIELLEELIKNEA